MEPQNSAEKPALLSDELLNGFVDKLVEDKDFGPLDQEVLESIKDDIKEETIEAINISLLKAMPEDKLPVLLQSLENEDAEEAAGIIKQAVPQTDEVIAQAMLQVRNAYLFS